MRGRLRKLGLGLALCTGAALLAGGALEIALRAGWIRNAQHARQGVSLAGAERRLLILGDSFMAPRALLGLTLSSELTARGWGVRNVATGGTGPFEYLDALKRVGPGLRPDVVLLSFYAGNDITDVQNHPRFEEGGSGRTGVAINRASETPILGDLYLYHYLRVRLSFLRVRMTDPGRLADAGIDPELIDDARNERINPYLLQLALHDKKHFLDNTLVEREASVRAWGKVEALLGEIHDACRELSARLVIVVFPHSTQVNDMHFELFRKMTFEMDERTLASSRPQELVRAFGERRGVPVLDLLPDFRARADEGLFLEKDDHLDREGHELAAERILEFLVGTGTGTGTGRGTDTGTGSGTGSGG